eukprot:6402692-Amphidinium_carterae.1
MPQLERTVLVCQGFRCSAGHDPMTGAIPTSLDAQLVFLGYNLLAGSIPHELLRGLDPAQKWVSVSTLGVPQM